GPPRRRAEPSPVGVRQSNSSRQVLTLLLQTLIITPLLDDGLVAMAPSLPLILLGLGPYWVTSLTSLHNSFRLYPRPYFGSQRLHVANDLDVVEIAALESVEPGENYNAEVPATMVPLSQPPLLLLESSKPIISREGCTLLSQYFEHLKNGDVARRMDGGQVYAAQKLLHGVHDVVDQVTNCPMHDGEKLLPSYVRYDSKIVDEEVLLDPRRLADALLPDGLHVDTNNGKLFRHVTAILYLTDNRDGCAMEESYRSQYGSMANDCVGAKGLLERGIQHTKGDVDESDASDGRSLENAALGLFRNTNELRRLDERYDNQFSNAKLHGLRVMPESGKLIYFHNVNDVGMPDPMSFHGGEELITILRDREGSNIDAPLPPIDTQTKRILVFFKEVPIHTFQSRGIEGFAERVRESRSWTKEMYY
ncbi:hypothetical protein THAOC_01930, partial [Thalassiosira oceanica]